MKALTESYPSNEAKAKSIFELFKSKSTSLSEGVILEDSIAILTQKTIKENNWEHWSFRGTM